MIAARVLPRDQIQACKFLAPDQHIVRGHEKPGPAIELQLDFSDEFVGD